MVRKVTHSRVKWYYKVTIWYTYSKEFHFLIRHSRQIFLSDLNMLLLVVVKAILVLGYETKRTDAVSLFLVWFHMIYCVLFPSSSCILSNVTLWEESYCILLIHVIDWFFPFATELAHISKRDAERKSDIIPCRRHGGRATAFLIAAFCIFDMKQISKLGTSSNTSVDISAVPSGSKQWKEDSGVG